MYLFIKPNYRIVSTSVGEVRSAPQNELYLWRITGSTYGTEEVFRYIGTIDISKTNATSCQLQQQRQRQCQRQPQQWQQQRHQHQKQRNASTAPDLSGSGRVDMLTRPVAAARAIYLARESVGA